MLRLTSRRWRACRGQPAAKLLLLFFLIILATFATTSDLLEKQRKSGTDQPPSFETVLKASAVLNDKPLYSAQTVLDDASKEVDTEDHDNYGALQGSPSHLGATNYVFARGIKSSTSGAQLSKPTNREEGEAPNVGQSGPDPTGSRHKRLLSTTLVESGTIRSPNFPALYGNNLDYMWILEATSPATQLLLQILHFSTESGYDFIRIYNQSGLQYSFSGAMTPRSVTISSPAVIRFTTDNSIVSQGFEISFSTVWSSGNDFSCGGRVRSPAHIMSPGFPHPYTTGRDCRWTLQASNANNSVLLKFEYLSTDEFSDYLMINDGSEFQYTFSGTLQPPDLLLRPPVEIIFVSENVLRNFNNSGFNITISDVARRAPRICHSGHWLIHGEQCVSVLWSIPYVTWTKGRSLCRSMGGYLVEPDDDEKLSYIGEFLAYHASQTDEVWIGLKRDQADDEWRWDTGRPLIYSSWATVQPDKVARNVSCAALTMHSVSGAWISDDCNALRAPMCMLLRRNGELRCNAE